MTDKDKKERKHKLSISGMGKVTPWEILQISKGKWENIIKTSANKFNI